MAFVSSRVLNLPSDAAFVEHAVVAAAGGNLGFPTSGRRGFGLVVELRPRDRDTMIIIIWNTTSTLTTWKKNAVEFRLAPREKQSFPETISDDQLSVSLML